MNQGRARAITVAAVVALVAACSPAPSVTPAAPSVTTNVSPGVGAATLTPTVGPAPSQSSTPAATSGPNSRPTLTPAPTPSGISHVVVVWMENREASSVTSSSMPYLSGLAQTYGTADRFYAVTHPSLPNYLALWSGSTHGISDDGSYDLGGPSLSRQMTDAGLSWRIYAQDYPASPGCHSASSYHGGADGPGVAGTYARKHVPAMSFTSVSGGSQCANIQPLASFDPGVNLAFVVPNLCNDMHDCSPSVGDAFLATFLPDVFDAPDWAHTLLVVSFDEGTSGAHGGGRVFTMVARAGLSGFASSTVHDHYGLLRTIEDVFGLPCLGASCRATPLTEFLP
jgi:phosphatidylinositol-3-phosphatase